MPNIKSQIKRMHTAEQQRQRNRSTKSALNSMIKKFYTAVESGDIEAARTAHVDAARALDKAVSKGIIHKNKAANEKSRMSRDFNSMT